MLNKSPKPHLIFIVIGLWFSWLPISEIYNRASIELQGVITSSNTSCVQPQNNRCSTVYLTQNSTSSTSKYIAGSTDASLQRYLPIGTKIEKLKWQLNYKINEKVVNDFPIGFYGGVLTFCITALGFGIYKEFKSKNS